MLKFCISLSLEINKKKKIDLKIQRSDIKLKNTTQQNIEIYWFFEIFKYQ